MMLIAGTLFGGTQLMRDRPLFGRHARDGEQDELEGRRS